MTESILIAKKWRKVEGVENLPRPILDKIILVCSGLASLRVAPDSENLEILSRNQHDHDEGEALVHQAIADENLRLEIKKKCNQEINFLINDVLTKVSNK